MWNIKLCKVLCHWGSMVTLHISATTNYFSLLFCWRFIFIIQETVQYKTTIILCMLWLKKLLQTAEGLLEYGIYTLSISFNTLNNFVYTDCNKWLSVISFLLLVSANTRSCLPPNSLTKSHIERSMWSLYICIR